MQLKCNFLIIYEWLHWSDLWITFCLRYFLFPSWLFQAKICQKKKEKLFAKNLENLDQRSTWKIFQVSQNLVPVETKPYMWDLHSLYSTLGPLNLIYSTYRFLWFVIFLKISDWWSFSVFKTTTGSQPEWRLLEVDEGDWRLLEVDKANYEGYWR